MEEITPQQRAAQTRKLNKIRKEEETEIHAWLKESGTYSETLTPLIETYLDAHVVYTHMYEKWRDEGFPATRMHTNKQGHTNEMKHPLAQQVADWNSKKSKLLEQLGLTPKLQKQVGGQPNSTTDAFQNFNSKWGADK
ncbi:MULTISPECIES: P27 family phage terminase small subunit [Bacillus]|uniref:P27 family phage terminase small subunit n=1 Tax=Bacillus TaxID=1386 RepID=UPI000696D123|nr:MULTISPECIES: P27 family phage terminase small subunit [Bacillus]MBC9023251.1 P27 family phage terminase small subunit [Bacillus subtilis]MCA0105708.1 P27 family phage terminase small subunit [Bacillus subtilis]MCH4866988.1 P27 family phage terminase small subunit [Bacillus sp. 1006-3]MCJ2152911.1 P27 family phage terminase small subunit [Bacillus subtilis]MCR4383351.1 P27 family phage terminase small subunit [Bacillus subtilis]